MLSRASLRLLAFVTLFGVMYLLLSSFWSDGLSHLVIDVATVEPAAWLARLVSADPGIVAVGSRIQSPQASINVLYGCEGTDVFMVLVAALLVAPVPWRARLPGLLAGGVFVFAVNQARVLALFYAYRWHRDWFGPIHGLLGPMLVVLAVTGFFLAWLRWANSGSGDVRPA
jgi:exosortase/archaeosortase family protein